MRTRLVLATLCVFNAIVVSMLAVVSLLFIDGDARFALAAAMGVAAVVLMALSRGLRRGAEWP